MTDGKIYIIVTDKLPSGGVEPQPGVETEKKDKKSDKDILMHYAKNKLIETVKSAASNAVHFSLGNIGNFTGDYIRQAQVNNALNLLNEVGNFAASAFAGFKVAGPWGALIAAGAYTIGKTINTAEYFISLDLQQRRTNYSIEQLRDRSGLNSHMNWNRGTEN